MKDFKTALFIAYKSVIKGSRSTSLLLIFILSLSFFNMLFISGILSGLQNLFYQAIINNYASYITISPQEKPQIKQYILNQNTVQASLQSIAGITATTRRYSLAGAIAFDKDKNGQYKTISGAIVGIDPTQDAKVTTIKSLLISGHYLSDADTDQIILSSALVGGNAGVPAPSDLGGAKVGDKVQVTYSNGVMRTYTIKGIYNDTIGIFETFISAKEAESVLNVYNSASQILVKTDLSKTPIGTYRTKVQQVVPRLKVQTYLDLLGSFKSFLDALNLISIIVSSISVVVATITIFVIIYINAISKRKQLGILKAIGITEHVLIVSYMFQSLFYAIVGILAGSAAVFLVLTPLLAAHPINVDFGYLSLVHTPSMIMGSIISFLGAGVLAGLIPAYIVARQPILQAIWGQ